MKSSERVYVELIFGSSNKYGAWDPEVEVKVGDYGSFTRPKMGLAFWRGKRRGIFIREGNIYQGGLAERRHIPPPKIHGSSAAKGITWIVSENAVETDLSADVASQTPALVNCSVKASFKFSKGQGAVLTMDRDAITTIDPPGALRPLLDDSNLQGKVIVSEVHSCSSYARYLGAPTSKDVTIGLAVEPPAGAVASANVQMRWMRSTNIGNFKTGIDEKGERSYYPLFRLVSLKQDDVTTGLRGTLEEAMQEPLPNAVPAWMNTGSGDESRKQKGELGLLARVIKRPFKRNTEISEPAHDHSEAEAAGEPLARVNSNSD